MNEEYRELTFEELLMINGGKVELKKNNPLIDTLTDGWNKITDKAGNDLNQVKNSWNNLWNKDNGENKSKTATSVNQKLNQHILGSCNLLML